MTNSYYIQFVLTWMFALFVSFSFAAKFGGGTISGATSLCNTSTVLTFNVSTCGGPGYTITGYQWEESDDNGVGDAWGNVVGGSGSTTVAYTTPTLSANIYYRCVITYTGSSCTGYSSPHTTSSTAISASAPGTTAAAGNDQSVCASFCNS